MADLNRLGLTNYKQRDPEQDQIDLSKTARVVKEHKELYIIQNAEGTFKAEITGNLRYSAASRADFPAVGDWVEATVFDGELAIITRILPRLSVLERQSVAAYGDVQIIATNLDVAFIVQAADRDFNLNRLERYFVLAHNGGIQPVIIINKSDLLTKDQSEEIIKQINSRLHNPVLFMTSTITETGLEEVVNYLERGKTYCFIGSSGVGKSSLINRLLGDELLDVNEISDSTHKGKHTTTHRELLLLDNGSILIDTPGMREVGMTETGSGIEMTFDDIAGLAQSCKFNNCTHVDEPGCSVLQAIEEGTLSLDEYQNFKKLERQTEHFSSTVAEKRRKDKAFGKMIKEVLKDKKKKKY